MTFWKIDMKILYLGTNTQTEFMSDTVFHGLRTLLGEAVVDAPRLHHMYADCQDNLLRYHGRGFSTTKLLEDINIDRTDIELKIKKKYFDKIIYGAIYRPDSLHYLNLVLENYNSNDIFYINGIDHPEETPKYLTNLSGTYFLRENSDSKHLPISFSIPEELIVSSVPDKEYYLMPLVPGVGETYVYDDQQEYFNMYQKSLFGLTWKKAGWDCLRHYEILSQGCLPLFLDIVHMPSNTMNTFPKREVENLLDVAVKINNYKKDMEFIYNHRNTIVNIDLSAIDFFDPIGYNYYEIAEQLLEYTKQQLTTKKIASYILGEIGKI
jgi:hypothetical protein